MAFVNAERTEITAKIVYYGPGLSGKTTCFHHIYRALPAANKGKLLSLATNIDRTIYFDFLPLKFENIQGYNLRIQLYTVPGQVRFNATRRMVLAEVDGIVFVADMQRPMFKDNQEAMKNLFDNLREVKLQLQEIPHVLQYNKEDLPELLSLEELNANLNLYKAPSFVTCALSGKGVLDALKGITKLVVADIKKRKVIEQHLQEVAREARAAFPKEPRERPRVAADDDPHAMARRLVKSGIRAPTSRMASDTPRPSPDTLARNIKSGMFEEVASSLSDDGPAAILQDVSAELNDELAGEPEPPLVEGEPWSTNGARPEKEIVVFSDKANELQSGIHRRKKMPEPAAPPALFDAGVDGEIDATLAVLPDDTGDILDVPSDAPANVDDTSKSLALGARRAAAGSSPSLAPLVAPADARAAFERLEKRIGDGDLAAVGEAARGALDRVLVDRDLFPDDALTIPAKMNLLGVKYARYLRFRRLTEPHPGLTLEEALLCLHFVADVAVAKRELGDSR